MSSVQFHLDNYGMLSLVCNTSDRKFRGRSYSLIIFDVLLDDSSQNGLELNHFNLHPLQPSAISFDDLSLYGREHQFF